MSLHLVTPSPRALKNYKLVFVPQWVAKTLSRKQIPLSAITDLNTLIEVLTYTDLACVALLQQKANEKFGFTLQIDDGVSREWSRHEHYETYIRALFSQAENDLHDRLFSFGESGAQGDAFEVKLVDGHTFVVVVNPGFFSSELQSESARKLIHTLTEVIAAHSSFDLLTQSNLFEKYVELLAVTA